VFLALAKDVRISKPSAFVIIIRQVAIMLP
jgi:hypothetical protein